jgi:hypothetical protein
VPPAVVMSVADFCLTFAEPTALCLETVFISSGISVSSHVSSIRAPAASASSCSWSLNSAMSDSLS